MGKTIRVHALAVLQEGESFRTLEAIMLVALKAKLADQGFVPASQVLWDVVPDMSKLPEELREDGKSLLRTMRDEENPGRLIICTLIGMHSTRKR